MPTKSLLVSKTFYGALIALFAVMFPTIWVAIGFQGDAAALADKLVGAIGTGIAIYGRLAATHNVTLTGK